MRVLRLIILLVLFLISTVPPAFAQGKPEFLPNAANGEAAIAALAEHLPAVANQNAMSPAELRELLEKDSTLWVDRGGELFYVDEALSDNEAAAEPAVSSAITEAMAFSLHSKPGASKTIMLDFNGHVTSGTVWNNSFNDGQDIITPAYDVDGNPSSFSSAELTFIEEIWKRVAEDFMPFDVDVTTADPGSENLRRSGSGDQNYGIRVVIGGSSSDWLGASAGGVAYVGSFDWDSDSPVFVFEDQLGNGHPKYTTEAASHEAGHAVGLNHDGVVDGPAYYSGHGSGETGWASIMGVGYYQNLTQWSKGEYANANNSQDDYSAMASQGLIFRADDHGDSRAAATVVDQGSSFTASGIIEQDVDNDYFQFSAGAGDAQIDVLPADVGPNLDIEVTIYNSGGTVLAQANPADLLNAGLAFSVPSDGNYFIKVDGVGKGDPLGTGYTDYGSLGQYTLTASITTGSGNQAPVAVAQASPLSGTAPLTVSFSASGSSDPDGSISSYSWDFGDGSSSNSASPSHTYTSEGVFTARLTVTDDDGATDSDSLTITVNPDPNFLAAPSNLAAAASGTTVTLTWTDNSSNEDGFRVLRGVETGRGKNKTITWSLAATVSSNTTSYLDSGMANGTYHYEIEAFNSSATAKSSRVKLNVGKGGRRNGNKN